MNTFAGAYDLPSLMAFAFVSDQSPFCASAGDAISALHAMAGGDTETAKSMVDLVAVCSLGHSLDPGLFRAATKLAITRLSPPPPPEPELASTGPRR